LCAQVLAEMDPDDILAKQVEQLEKEKRELQEKLKAQEKKVCGQKLCLCRNNIAPVGLNLYITIVISSYHCTNCRIHRSSLLLLLEVLIWLSKKELTDVRGGWL